jgi:hypothetical protein
VCAERGWRPGPCAQEGQTSALGQFTLLTEEQYHAQYADHTVAWSVVGVAAALFIAAPYWYSLQLGAKATGGKDKSL